MGQSIVGHDDVAWTEYGSRDNLAPCLENRLPHLVVQTATYQSSLLALL